MVDPVSNKKQPAARRGRPAALSREAERVLSLLSEPEAYGVQGEKGEIVVAAPRNGVSIRVGSFRSVTLAPLEAGALVIWEAAGPSGRRRVRATMEGRAHAARHAASDLAKSGALPGADPFLAQHKPLAPAAAGEARVLVDEAESPLAWLARRRGRDGLPFVDAACLEAGERLRRDLAIGAMLPRTTANWSAAVASGPRSMGPTDFTDSMIAARQRARAALASVGPDFSGLLLDICGFLKGLETVERERQWPARSGKLVLGLALRQLCRHYGFEPIARGKGKVGLRQWGASDYRPQLQAGL